MSKPGGERRERLGVYMTAGTASMTYIHLHPAQPPAPSLHDMSAVARGPPITPARVVLEAMMEKLTPMAEDACQRVRYSVTAG